MSLRWQSFAPVLALGILTTVVTVALNSGEAGGFVSPPPGTVSYYVGDAPVLHRAGPGAGASARW